MNRYITRKTMLTRRVLAGAAALVLAAPLGLTWAATRTGKTAPVMGAGYIPVNGKRVVLMLPVQTGEGWTANPVFTRNVKQRASTILRNSLVNTGQFSLIEVDRSNPVLQRGVVDGLYSQEDLDALFADPTPDTARNVLSKLTFNRAPKLPFTQAPLIAQMTLDTYPTQAGSATVQVTGNLYEMGESENTVFRTKTVVSPLSERMMPAPRHMRTSRKNRNKSAPVMTYRTSDLLLGGLTTAFTQIATDFARPLQEAESPFLEVPAGPTLPSATPAPRPAPVDPNATPVPIPTEVPPAATAEPEASEASGEDEMTEE